MEIEFIINTICEKIGKLPEDTAKRKFGKLPKYTYKDILERIILGNNTSLDEVFPEMSRPTISRVLNKCFPEKAGIYSSLDWFCYLLSIVNMKRCLKCNTIKYTEEFNKAYTKNCGLSSLCRTCDNSSNKIHREENKDHYKLAHHMHYLDNKPLYIAKKAKRRATKLHASVSWANIEEINNIYTYCKEGYHVDHIVPLQGTNVCGLHCEHNLQYLLAHDNLSKGNSFNSDTYIHSTTYIPPYS